MGIYTSPIGVTLKASWVGRIGELNNLPTPNSAGRWASLTEDQIDAWIKASEEEDTTKEVFFIGQVLHDHRLRHKNDERGYHLIFS